MATLRRFKYGILVHPAVADPGAVALTYCRGLVESFIDAQAPDLGSVEVRWKVSIVRVDDTVVFEVFHTPDQLQLIRDDLSGPVRQGLLEALDWWNGETLLIAPQEAGLTWDGHTFPNAWSDPWSEGLQVQNITQYPNRLGKKVLAEWNPGLCYVPFEVLYTPPTREEEVAAMSRWTAEQEVLVHTALEQQVPLEGGSWFLSPAQRYRSALAPLPSQVRPVGSLASAEKAAEDYRGACFLIDRSTREILSRWYER